MARAVGRRRPAAGREVLVDGRGRRDLVDAALLGPGPVAETFPAPLRPLEADLWVAPLAEGIAEALHLTGAARPTDRAAAARLAGSPWSCWLWPCWAAASQS